MSRGTCWLFHRWSDWRVKPDPTPYTPEWAMSWRVCQRCGMWEWKPSRRERVTQIIVQTALVLGLLAWPVIGLVKFVEWLS